MQDSDARCPNMAGGGEAVPSGYARTVTVRAWFVETQGAVGVMDRPCDGAGAAKS